MADVGGIDGLCRQIMGGGSLGSFDALFGDGFRARQPGIGTDCGDDSDGEDGSGNFFIFSFHRFTPFLLSLKFDVEGIL